MRQFDLLKLVNGLDYLHEAAKPPTNFAKVSTNSIGKDENTAWQYNILKFCEFIESRPGEYMVGLLGHANGVNRHFAQWEMFGYKPAQCFIVDRDPKVVQALRKYILYNYTVPICYNEPKKPNYQKLKKSERQDARQKYQELLDVYENRDSVDLLYKSSPLMVIKGDLIKSARKLQYNATMRQFFDGQLGKMQPTLITKFSNIVGCGHKYTRDNIDKASLHKACNAYVYQSNLLAANGVGEPLLYTTNTHAETSDKVFAGGALNAAKDIKPEFKITYVDFDGTQGIHKVASGVTQLTNSKYFPDLRFFTVVATFPRHGAMEAERSYLYVASDSIQHKLLFHDFGRELRRYIVNNYSEGMYSTFRALLYNTVFNVREVELYMNDSIVDSEWRYIYTVYKGKGTNMIAFVFMKNVDEELFDYARAEYGNKQSYHRQSFNITLDKEFLQEHKDLMYDGFSFIKERLQESESYPLKIEQDFCDFIDETVKKLEAMDPVGYTVDYSLSSSMLLPDANRDYSYEPSLSGAEEYFEYFDFSLRNYNIL